jgi:hypothetical protein
VPLAATIVADFAECYPAVAESTRGWAPGEQAFGRRKPLSHKLKSAIETTWLDLARWQEVTCPPYIFTGRSPLRMAAHLTANLLSISDSGVAEIDCRVMMRRNEELRRKTKFP